MNISKTTSGLIALLFAAPFACAQSYIPQIADGGGWQTTIVLTNTSPSATTASLAFYQETTGGATQTWNPPFQEVTSTQTISIAGGATVFLHTTNTAKTTSVGWAQLNGGFTVVAYAIFTQFVTGRQNQDGTAPAAAGTTRVLVPYDNTNGFLTTVAIANPAALSESIATGISTTGGACSRTHGVQSAGAVPGDHWPGRARRVLCDERQPVDCCAALQSERRVYGCPRISANRRAHHRVDHWRNAAAVH